MGRLTPLEDYFRDPPAFAFSDLTAKQARCCLLAERFEAWTAELTRLLAGPLATGEYETALSAIRHAKMELQDKWHDWRSLAPANHRAYAGAHHRCLFHVYLDCYLSLRTRELSLVAPPAQARRREVAEQAIFIGVRDGGQG